MVFCYFKSKLANYFSLVVKVWVTKYKVFLINFAIVTTVLLIKL